MAYCSLEYLKEWIPEDELIQLTDDRSHLASGHLSGEIDAAQEVIALIDTSGFPDSGRLEIDSEQIDYGGKSGNQLLGCVRGVNKTTPAPHPDGALVRELNTINPSVIERAIADAEAEIESYLAGRYELPLLTVPAIVRKITVDLAIYNLYFRRRGFLASEWQERYRAALRFLENVAQGVASLGADAPAEIRHLGPAATGSRQDRIFSLGRISDGSFGTLDRY